MKKSLSLLLSLVIIISLLISCGGSEETSETVSDANNGSAEASVAISEDDMSEVESGESDISEESAPVFVNTPYRTAVSSRCGYTVVKGTLSSDDTASKLTDGEFETVCLNVDRAAIATGAKVEIVVDLGSRIENMTSFQAHYIIGNVAGEEPSLFTVSVSDDNVNFEKAGSVTPTAQPSRAVGHIDYATVICENGVSGRYVKFTLNPLSGSKLYLQELIAFTGSTDFTEDRKLAYETIPETPVKGVVLPTWTFDTQMPNYGASDEEYETYFTYLKNAGFEGIILLSNGGYDGKSINSTILKTILEYCKKYGMKIFAGLTMSKYSFDELYDNSAYADEFIASMERVMDNIYSAFGIDYSEQLYGWYFNLELNNIAYNKSPELAAKLLNGVIAKANELDGDMPILMSPYTAAWGGNASALKKSLTKFFDLTNFRSFDIYCPQDSVGAGLVDISASAGYFKVMKECCDKKGIILWANVENFVIKSSVPGYESDTLPAPVSRFVTQINNIKEYISGCTTFTFQAYTPEDVFNYTIHNEVTYYYNQLLKYANTGKIAAETNPEILEVTQSEPVDGYITVTAKMNIPTYHIDIVTVDYDGVRHSFGSYYLTEVDGFTYLSFRSYVGDTGDSGRIYTLCAYDHSSTASGTYLIGYNADVTNIFTTEIDRTKTRTVVSTGASYTTSIAPTHSNGDNGTELTDGKHGNASSFSDAPWSGYDKAVTVTIDLGEIKTGVADIVIYMLSGGTGAIYEPKALSVKGSMDGATYYDFGSLSFVLDNQNKLFAVNHTIELETGASCRYIQIDISPIGWYFMDEIEIVTYE